jgi:hypothetical protein
VVSHGFLSFALIVGKISAALAISFANSLPRRIIFEFTLVVMFNIQAALLEFILDYL